VEVPDAARAAQDFTYKVDGVTHRIDLLSVDPLLDRALRNISARQLEGFTGQLATLTRRFSQMVTSYTPSFLFRNAIRDFQDALVNAGVEQGAGVSGRIAREVLSTRALREAYRATKDPTHPAAQLFREFREDGGAIGWSQTKTPREIEAALRADIRSAGPGLLNQGKRVTRAMVSFVEDANKAVENSTRFAVYKALREAGVDRFHAGHAARNVTLDFTKKGEAGPLLNGAYAFFNANVQGIKRLKEVAIDNPRGRRVAAAIVAAGAVMDAYNRMHSGDSNHDGTPDYDDIPEFLKQKNFIVMRGEGKRPLMFPMPYGFSMIWTLGRKGSAAAEGAETPGQAALGTLGAAWNAFNPLGGEAGLVQTLSPTVLDPFVQHATNQTWTGRPLVPEPPEHGAPKPPSELYWKNAPPLAKAVARELNEATGGDAHTPGWISVSPEILAHYTDAANAYVTGGLGKETLQVAQAAGTLAAGGTPEIRNLPVVKSFLYEPSPGAAGQKYHANKQELQGAAALEKTYLKEGSSKGIARVPQALLAIAPVFSQIDKQITALRKAGAPEEQITKLQNEANRLVAEAKRRMASPPGPPGPPGPPEAPSLVASAGADEAPTSPDPDWVNQQLGIGGGSR
jgi:hypothetical protein